MSFLNLVNKRCSIRSYSSQPIEKEKIDYVLEAVRLAPSACNLQPWYFLVIQDKERVAEVQKLYPREWTQTVPAFILVLQNNQESWKRKYDGKDHADIDAAIAAEHICLAAAEQGLGTCWICSFETKQCADLFQLPGHIEPVVIIALGYPTDDSLFTTTPKVRKPIADIVRYNHFNE